MRWLLGICVLFIGMTVSGCAIIEAEKDNRGGFLDRAADDLWMKADSKKMRTLRALAIEASLARIAMIAPKTAQDRALLARRIGTTTQRADVVRRCAFGPRLVPGQLDSEPCFFFDSVMVDYENALFDLALISLPLEDARTLITRVSGGVAAVSVNPLQLVQALLDIGREAFRYGRVVGAIYRDTMELEVKVWLESPGLADRVVALRAVYDRGNGTDNIPAWRAEIAALRAQGLEPVPDVRFLQQVFGILQYICGQIVSTTDPAYEECAQRKLLQGFSVVTVESTTLFPAPIRVTTTTTAVPGNAGRPSPGRAVRPEERPEARLPPPDDVFPAAEQILDPYMARVHTRSFVIRLQEDLCVPSSERGTIGPVTRALINIYEMTAKPRSPQERDGKLNDAEITDIRGQRPRCIPGAGQNFFEQRTYTHDERGARALLQLVDGLNKLKLGEDLPQGTTLDGARARIRQARKDPVFSAKLEIMLPDELAGEVTRDFVAALPR
jgi:hypothetical protein